MITDYKNTDLSLVLKKVTYIASIKDLTLQEVARKVNISKDVLYKFARGCAPRLSTIKYIESIAKVLEVPVSVLLDKSDSIILN